MRYQTNKDRNTMENMDEKLIKELATELANYEYNELSDKLSEMTFIEAYNALKGFNLEMDDLTCNGELFGIQVRFDYNYKHINGTIFKDGEYCELGETITVWDSNFVSPIIDSMLPTLD